MELALNEICYQKNYLKEVVSLINFLEPVEVLSGKILPDEINNCIRKTYEIYEPRTAIRRGITIHEKEILQKNEEFQEWKFHGSNREKSISLNRHQVDVSFNDYKNYEQFKKDFLDPIGSIKGESEIYIERTGLRFINIFSNLLTSFEEIKEYFSPMISGQFTEVFNKENCSRSFLITEYTYGDIKIRMQTGIYNSDHPAKIKNLEFIVDIDGYIDTPHLFNDIEKTMDKIHNAIQKTFEASITEKLRAHLKEKPYK